MFVNNMRKDRIDVVVIELTTKCDLNCMFCSINRKNDSIDSKLLMKLLEENYRLGNSIDVFELGWGGNPLLHKNIKKIIGLFNKYNLRINIVTNGFNLVNILKKFEGNLLDGIHFTIFLDSSNEKRNDLLMGKKNAFKKTLNAIDYLKSRNLSYDILMRLTSKNYGDIESMVNLCKMDGCGLLIPIEIFPPIEDRKLLLNDGMKLEAMNTIDNLRNNGQPVHKVIHFEIPSGNCTYLRYKRLFINSRGNLGFCHFLTHLIKNEMTDCRKYNFSQLLQINDSVRKRFVGKKEQQMENWKYPRKTASPCSYCMQQLGVKYKW
jgi:MoaA/NifB/PqqE/SkfB family radical SAM enzyme